MCKSVMVSQFGLWAERDVVMACAHSVMTFLFQGAFVKLGTYQVLVLFVGGQQHAAGKVATQVRVEAARSMAGELHWCPSGPPPSDARHSSLAAKAASYYKLSRTCSLFG